MQNLRYGDRDWQLICNVIMGGGGFHTKVVRVCSPLTQNPTCSMTVVRFDTSSIKIMITFYKLIAVHKLRRIVILETHASLDNDKLCFWPVLVISYKNSNGTNELQLLRLTKVYIYFIFETFSAAFNRKLIKNCIQLRFQLLLINFTANNYSNRLSQLGVGCFRCNRGCCVWVKDFCGWVRMCGINQEIIMLIMVYWHKNKT